MRGIGTHPQRPMSAPSVKEGVTGGRNLRTPLWVSGQAWRGMYMFFLYMALGHSHNPPSTLRVQQPASLDGQDRAKIVMDHTISIPRHVHSGFAEDEAKTPCLWIPTAAVDELLVSTLPSDPVCQ